MVYVGGQGFVNHNLTLAEYPHLAPGGPLQIIPDLETKNESRTDSLAVFKKLCQCGAGPAFIAEVVFGIKLGYYL